MYDILRQGRAPHVIGMATAGLRRKLMYMSYPGTGHVALLHTKSYQIPMMYDVKALNTLKAILTEVWRLRTFMAGSLSNERGSMDLVGGKLPHDLPRSLDSEI